MTTVVIRRGSVNASVRVTQKFQHFTTHCLPSTFCQEDLRSRSFRHEILLAEGAGHENGDLGIKLRLLVDIEMKTIKKLQINTDSEFTINSVTQQMPGWKKKSWRKAEGEEVVKNDLVILVGNLFSLGLCLKVLKLRGLTSDGDTCGVTPASRATRRWTSNIFQLFYEFCI